MPLFKKMHNKAIQNQFTTAVTVHTMLTSFYLLVQKKYSGTKKNLALLFHNAMYSHSLGVVRQFSAVLLNYN